jgi:putative ABC transport system permease protein
MNSLKITFSYLKFNKLNSFLIIFLLAFGFCSIALLFAFSNSIENKMQNDASAIDLVVGAKGSPLQLVLSSVYHADIPTGNISFSQAETISKLPQVKDYLKIGLGDNYKNFRIVGTQDKFIDFYNIKISQGKNFNKPFQAVIGYNTAKNAGLKIGDKFAGAHGLVGSTDVHDEFMYEVVGVLEKNFSVIDDLIFVDLKSVWQVHADHHHEEGHDHKHEHSHSHKHEKHSNNDITAVLIKTKSSLDIFNLPRKINKTTNMLAASPAYEAARLMQLLNVGSKLIKIFAYCLIIASILMIFISLISSLKKRIYDFAVIRAIGGSRFFITKNIILECLLVTIIGLLIGYTIFAFLIEFLPSMFFELSGLNLKSQLFNNQILFFAFFILFLSLLAGLLPAIKAYNVDVIKNLK